MTQNHFISVLIEIVNDGHHEPPSLSMMSEKNSEEF